MVDIIDPKWSELDAANNSAAPDGIQGTYAPSTVAPILKGTRGAIKRAYTRINAIYTTTGTSAALVLTYAQAPAAYSKGERIAFFPNATNEGPMTLNINSLGTKSILAADGTPLTAGDIASGEFTELVYDGTAFRIVSGGGAKFSGTVTAGSFAGNGSALTALNASNIATGTINEARFPATFNGNKTFNGGLTLNGATAADRTIGWQTAGTRHWSAFTTNGTGEAGSNGGSDFALARHTDNGTYIDLALSINRATGSVNIPNGLSVGGNRVLTVADYGTGKGIDADKLDGQEGSYYLNRANQTGSVPLANVTNLQGSLDAKLNLTGGTITGGLVVNGGMSSAGDISINKANPSLTLHYPGVRQGQMLVDGSGSLIWRDQGSGDIKMYITDGGAIWTKELGSLNNRIEGRALAWANDRVANLSSRLVARGVSTANDWEGASGTVVTGYTREGGTAGQVRTLYYRYLQMFDPVRGWVGTYYT
ncbi:hypothetical protein RMR21_015700 [Agrobacterium sp. rho-8.1]|nr:hypothetical protein [Agrobacterium sp. rho-8.1]